jgi:hypothetical protein
MVVRVADDEIRELTVSSLEDARKRRDERWGGRGRDTPVEAEPTEAERFDSMLDLADTVTLPDGFGADGDERELSPDERLAPYGTTDNAEGSPDGGAANGHSSSPDDILSGLGSRTDVRQAARSMPRGSADLAPQRRRTKRRRPARAEQTASRRNSSPDLSPERSERGGIASSAHLRRQLVLLAAVCVVAGAAILDFGLATRSQPQLATGSSAQIKDPFTFGAFVKELAWGRPILHPKPHAPTRRVINRRHSRPLRRRRPTSSAKPRHAVGTEHSVAKVPASVVSSTSESPVMSRPTPAAPTAPEKTVTQTPTVATKQPAVTKKPPASTTQQSAVTKKQVITTPSTTDCRGAGVLSSTNCGRPSL